MKNSINKNFFILYFGQAISLLTSSILQMAIIWYLITKTNSPSTIALAGIMAFLPQGILGLFVGVYVDRYNRKNIMIISDFAIATVSFVLVLSGILGDIPTWLIMTVLCARSIGTAFYQPSLQAVTPLIVSKDALTKYSGYSQFLQSISLIISPAIAATLFAIWKLEYIIFLECIGGIIGIICIILTKIPNHKKIYVSKTKHFSIEIKESFAVLKKHRLMSFLITGATFSIVYMPIFVLYPMMTLSYFGKSKWSASIVEIVFAIGMSLGATTLSHIKIIHNKILTVSISSFAIGLCLFFSGLLSVHDFMWFAIFSLILGFASTFYEGLQIIVFQERIDNQFLGRIMSLSSGLMVIGTPVGIAISGLVAELIGIDKYFLLSGIGIIIISIFYSWIAFKNKKL